MKRMLLDLFLCLKKKALVIEKEFYNNVLPTILHDMPKKEMKAKFCNLGSFLFDIQKAKKTIKKFFHALPFVNI